MLSLEFTKKIDLVTKVLEIVDSSNIKELKNEIDSYHDKHLAFMEKYYREASESKSDLEIELKKLNPINNDFFKKYYRNIVRSNSKLESFVVNINKNDLEILGIEKLISFSKKIEDFIFNIGDSEDFSLRSFNDLNRYLVEYTSVSSTFYVMKTLYNSINQEKRIPSNYKNFEITFYTVDQSLESFSLRVASLKLMYEIFMRLHDITENESNKLIVIKAEKENTEYYKIAGLELIINEINFISKEWIKESSDKSMDLTHTKNIERRIKGLIEKEQINLNTGEKYLDVIKKALKNLQISKCLGVELNEENTNIVQSDPTPIIAEIINEQPKIKTYNDNMVENKESDTLKGIENSLLAPLTLSKIKNQPVEYIFQRGITLMSIKRYNDAIIYFDKVISIKPDFADAYNYKANAYINTGKHLEAIKFTDQAINLKSDYKDAYLNKGTAFFSLAKYDDALIQYRKTVEIDNKYSEGFFNLGSCYMMIEGKKKDAIDSFTKAIEINPSYASAFYNRACAYVSEKEYDNGIKDLESAVKLENSFKNILKFDHDFDPIHEYPRFKNLIS
ncbi:MAG: hypothetical protein H7263_08175 [Candidatus Sericytochromatia bacterium]|nr:hypothetical protein [Candidatus Sericytochromatia bacterium]